MKNLSVWILLIIILFLGFLWWRAKINHNFVVIQTTQPHAKKSPLQPAAKTTSQSRKSAEKPAAKKTSNTFGYQPYSEENTEAPVAETNKAVSPPKPGTASEPAPAPAPEEPAVTNTAISEVAAAVIAVKWTQVSSGDGDTLAIKEDGTLWAWGRGYDGELGLGITHDVTAPVRVGNENNWKYVVCNNNETLAIKTNGTLWAWGNYLGFRVARGRTDHNRPEQVSPDTDWQDVSIAYNRIAALKTNGTLWMWEETPRASATKKDSSDFLAFSRMGADTDWKTIKCGLFDTIGLKNDGTLWTWSDISSTITQIGIDQDWSSIAHNNSIYYGIKNAVSSYFPGSTLWAWGTGNLGVGYIAMFNTPVQITYGKKWSRIADPDLHTLAIDSDGALWSWGDNAYGELGLGDSGYGTDRYVPTRLGLDIDWISVAAGYGTSFALKADGSLWAWGNNYYGELGLGNKKTKHNFVYPTEVK